jgi:heme oxygenase (biliverdin-IX-beta and delta-forming)
MTSPPSSATISPVTRHAGPSPPDDEAPIPEPTYAERARSLVYVERVGALSTLSRKHPGHPFGSVTPYGLDDRGRPLLLISTMAMHTQNLQADGRASLLVAQPDWAGDPLAAGRVTLMGEVRPVDASTRAGARAAYLGRHDNARYWVDFDDFGFWRLEVRDVYFVGGFAAMDWIDAPTYASARPDPLADAAGGIVGHMNRDHADALIAYARAFAGVEADEATMVDVDRLGFKLRVTHGDRRHSVRIAFPHEVTTAADSRTVLIEMLRRARGEP